MAMANLEAWELASYIVTVIGFPFAIIVYLMDQQKERQNEEEEIYQRLSDEYAEFLQLLLKNADLQLMSKHSASMELSPEGHERKKIIFDILVSLFERAYILVYEEDMNKQTQRLWASWEDYIKFWCSKEDFIKALPELLQGEDPDFGKYMKKMSAEVCIK